MYSIWILQAVIHDSHCTPAFIISGATCKNGSSDINEVIIFVEGAKIFIYYFVINFHQIISLLAKIKACYF